MRTRSSELPHSKENETADALTKTCIERKTLFLLHHTDGIVGIASIQQVLLRLPSERPRSGDDGHRSGQKVGNGIHHVLVVLHLAIPYVIVDTCDRQFGGVFAILRLEQRIGNVKVLGIAAQPQNRHELDTGRILGKDCPDLLHDRDDVLPGTKEDHLLHGKVLAAIFQRYSTGLDGNFVPNFQLRFQYFGLLVFQGRMKW